MQGAGWHSFPSNKNTFGLQASCLEIIIRMYSLELQIGGMKHVMPTLSPFGLCLHVGRCATFSTLDFGVNE